MKLCGVPVSIDQLRWLCGLFHCLHGDNIQIKFISLIHTRQTRFFLMYCSQVQKVSNYRSKTGVSTPGRHALSGAGTGSQRGDMEIEFPCKDVLKQKKIIVSTLVTSGRYMSSIILWNTSKKLAWYVYWWSVMVLEVKTLIPSLLLTDIVMYM